MREHSFGFAHARHNRRYRVARIRSQLLVGNHFQELPYPKPTRVTRRSRRRERVVGANALVAICNSAFLTQEKAAVVLQLGKVIIVALSHDLEMLRAILVADGNCLLIILGDNHFAVVTPGDPRDCRRRKRLQLKLDFLEYRFAKRS